MFHCTHDQSGIKFICNLQGIDPYLKALSSNTQNKNTTDNSNKTKIYELQFLSCEEIMLFSTTEKRNLKQNQSHLLACIAHSHNLTRNFSPLNNKQNSLNVSWHFKTH